MIWTGDTSDLLKYLVIALGALLLIKGFMTPSRGSGNGNGGGNNGSNNNNNSTPPTPPAGGPPTV